MVGILCSCHVLCCFHSRLPKKTKAPPVKSTIEPEGLPSTSHFWDPPPKTLRLYNGRKSHELVYLIHILPASVLPSISAFQCPLHSSMIFIVSSCRKKTHTRKYIKINFFVNNAKK